VDDPSKPLPKAEADALIQEHLEYDHALQREGKFVTAGALATGGSGRMVMVREGKLSVTDGPFAETKEELGGFYVLEAKDLDEAVRLAAGIPSARHGRIEVRPYRQLFDDLHPPPPPRPAPRWPPPLRLERKPAIALAGFSARYTPETLRRIPAQWGRFGAEVGAIAGVTARESHGLCFEWRDGTMEYACALPVSPGAHLPEGWRPLMLPASRYAVFSHEDHVSTMMKAIEWILHTWLPGSGERRAPGFAGGVELVEWYGPAFDPETGYGDVEIWVPLEG
jgi:predicted transcriptional regulator YdeE